MAVSRKMLEVIQKVDAAREEFLNGLRETAKRDARRRAKLKWGTTNRKPPTKSALVREASPARKRRAG